jgi:hypothetical protein
MEPPLTPAAAWAVLNKQADAPSQLWAQAAALMSAGLDDD